MNNPHTMQLSIVIRNSVKGNIKQKSLNVLLLCNKNDSTAKMRMFSCHLVTFPTYRHATSHVHGMGLTCGLNTASSLEHDWLHAGALSHTPDTKYPAFKIVYYFLKSHREWYDAPKDSNSIGLTSSHWKVSCQAWTLLLICWIWKCFRN